MAKGIENRARSPPAVFDFATSQIQKHGGTKMYYDLVESGKRIKALRKEHLCLRTPAPSHENE